MKEQKFKAITQWFKRDTINFDDLSFEVYRPTEKEEDERKGNPLDELLKLAEEKNKKRKGDFFILSIESLETKYVIADGIKDKNTRLLYNIPTKLNRIGLVKRDKLKIGQEGYFILKNDDIKWIDIDQEVYIYDGPLKASDDVELVIFETDKDRRIIKTQHLSMMKLSFQTPEQQNQSDHGNENELNEDNNPS